MSTPKRILISGGGTGGHIFPAVSIANAIKDTYPDSEILFVGAQGRMEMEKVPAAGYPIKGLPIQGLFRPLYSPKNLLVALKYVFSLYKANQIIQQFKPDIAIGVGGYASAAVVECAAKKGIPTLIQEQNSFAGQTNKRLSKYCQKICVAYDGMERFFPAHKILKTGNPVRQNLLQVPQHSAEAYRFFQLDPNKKTLLIIGGSLGARTINQSLLKDIEMLYKEHQDNLQVIWQTGKFYIDEIKQATAALPIKNMIITDFIARMDWAYSIADLVISRAGASSISELSLLGKACILVPSPNVSEDHQTQNALALVNRGAAIMVTDKEAPQQLVSTALSLIFNNEQLQTLQQNIVYFAKPQAAQQIAQEVGKLLGIGKKQYYFLGIGGIGMSAIARYFNQRGHWVAGYDLTRTPLTEALEKEGIAVHYQDNIQLVPAPFMDKENTVIVYTPAIPSNMSEWVYFKEAQFTLLKRSEILGELTQGQAALCVAGTHGKTTTSTLLAHLLNQRQEGVNAFLGGIAKNYQTNLLTSTQSNQVVVEADEYDRSFLRLTPNMAVITATDADHLDIYGTHQQLLQAFADFTALIEPNGTLLVKKGLPLQPNTHPSVTIYTYSSTQEADFYAQNVQVDNGNLYFDFVSPQGRINHVSLGVPVLINVENAVAAMAIAQLNGVTNQQLSQGVASFQGSKRRFDIQVKNNRHVYIDDYAHHPAEIEACVQSIKHLYPNKKICGVFQPHLYTRTRDFAQEFAQSLSLLDQVILLEIYPARELPIPGVDAALIAQQITHKNWVICPDKQLLVQELKQHHFDVLLTIGAGNIDQVVPQVAQYVATL